MQSHDEFWAEYMINAHDEEYHGKGCHKDTHVLGPQQVDESKLWVGRTPIWVLAR